MVRLISIITSKKNALVNNRYCAHGRTMDAALHVVIVLVTRGTGTGSTIAKDHWDEQTRHIYVYIYYRTLFPGQFFMCTLLLVSLAIFLVSDNRSAQKGLAQQRYFLRTKQKTQQLALWLLNNVCKYYIIDVYSYIYRNRIRRVYCVLLFSVLQRRKKKRFQPLSIIHESCGQTSYLYICE